jgi:DNA-binding IclR family transcriptional regulator
VGRATRDEINEPAESTRRRPGRAATAAQRRAPALRDSDAAEDEDHSPADISGDKDRQFVTALARGLEVLSCFSAARPALSGTEIAGLLGLPQPTVWRLCRTMTKLGYLAVGSDERLRPALPVLRLGYTILSELTPIELARPHLQELADAAEGAAGLAVRDGSDMRFVERCESHSQLLMNLKVGSRVPVATSALGWAYLAGFPQDEREALLGQVRPDHRVWRAVEKPLRRALDAYASDGFIINDGVFHPGYNTAAAPVLGSDGRPVFAINCGGAASILSIEKLRREIGPRLRDLAALLRTAS